MADKEITFVFEEVEVSLKITLPRTEIGVRFHFVNNTGKPITIEGNGKDILTLID